jgi:uncharacterized protein
MRAMARWKLTSSRSWPGVTGPGPQAAAGLGLAQVALLGALRAYKLVLSPLFAGACRHVPSCSTYAAEAVTIHGAARGAWLAAKRLARCHPFGTSGFDPVPPAPVAQTPDRVPR